MMRWVLSLRPKISVSMEHLESLWFTVGLQLRLRKQMPHWPAWVSITKIFSCSLFESKIWKTALCEATH